MFNLKEYHMMRSIIASSDLGIMDRFKLSLTCWHMLDKVG